jgi:hypothetical protein
VSFTATGGGKVCCEVLEFGGEPTYDADNNDCVYSEPGSEGAIAATPATEGYCCDGVCQEEPCEVCCCCEKDGVEEIDCRTLSALEGEDCFTGVDEPVFGNLFGDWALCTFTVTPGPCDEPP